VLQRRDISLHITLNGEQFELDHPVSVTDLLRNLILWRAFVSQR